MKKIMLLLPFCFLLFQNCDTPAQTASSAKMVDVSVEEFKQKMGEPDVVILDVRTPGETAAGMIEGAKEINVNDADFAQQIEALDKDKTYLVYCKMGGRSAKACGIMEEKGFEKLYNLKGGYTAWSK